MKRGLKNDSEARATWGAAYDDVPKSVFAVMAWHLATNCVEAEDDDLIKARLIEEVEALTGQVIDQAQGARALKALRAAFAKTEG